MKPSDLGVAVGLNLGALVLEHFRCFSIASRFHAVIWAECNFCLVARFATVCWPFIALQGNSRLELGR